MHERFEGIVLFKRKHREHDALVKIFTLEYGTKMFFVRRLEKPNHPLASQLIPLTHNQYIGTIQQSGLSFFQEGETLHFFRLLQSDYIKQAYAVYLAQLVDAAIEDNQPNSDLYLLFKAALQAIEANKEVEVVTAYMELQLLNYFGVGINLQHCVECGSTEQPFDFSLRRQGVLCRRHYDVDEFRLRINPRAMYVATILASVSLNQIQSINVSAETLTELRRFLDEVYDEFVGLRLRSKHYLTQLKQIEESAAILLTQRASKQAKSTDSD